MRQKDISSFFLKKVIFLIWRIENKTLRCIFQQDCEIESKNRYTVAIMRMISNGVIVKE